MKRLTPLLLATTLSCAKVEYTTEPGVPHSGKQETLKHHNRYVAETLIDKVSGKEGFQFYGPAGLVQVQVLETAQDKKTYLQLLVRNDLEKDRGCDMGMIQYIDFQPYGNIDLLYHHQEDSKNKTLKTEQAPLPKNPALIEEEYGFALVMANHAVNSHETIPEKDPMVAYMSDHGKYARKRLKKCAE